MSIKINKLEIENTKRVKAVRIQPSANGLTIVGGKNAQGKTSVLDSIAWVLGGNKYKPTNAQREGSTLPPTLKVVLSNGLVVERKGKNSDLKVTDPSGTKPGQTLLDSFVEEFALNLPKFLEQNSKDKARTLLQIIGVGDQLFELERQENETFNQRHAIGQIADKKKKFAEEQNYYTDAPRELVSPSELLIQQQDILVRNGENNRKRQNLEYIENQNKALHAQLADLQSKILASDKDLEIARKNALDLHDESTEELEASIQNIDEINRKVRANLDKEKAEDDAKDYADQYAQLTGQLENIRNTKINLLQDADLPLPGLSVEDGELTYNGFKWDGMSSAEQLKVATAIVRKLNPECGFVLIDKLEQMDLDTLSEFGQWLEIEGLQAIATRVSTGDECSIIIEDGYAVGQDFEAEKETDTDIETWEGAQW